MSTHSQTVSPVSPAHGSYLSSSLSSSNLSASSYLVSPVQRATVQFTGSNLASSSPVTNSHGVYPTSVQPPRSPPQVPTNQPQQSSGTQPAAFPNPSSSSSSTGTLLIFLPLFGIGFCVAHALYYKSLDGTQVQTTWNQQEWASRFGNAFAFLAKTCFTGGIAVGYTQHIWTTFRKKSLTIEDIDAIFSATSDLTSFWWSDMWTRAKFATFLAILTWFVGLSNKPSVYKGWPWDSVLTYQQVCSLHRRNYAWYVVHRNERGHRVSTAGCPKHRLHVMQVFSVLRFREQNFNPRLFNIRASIPVDNGYSCRSAGPPNPCAVPKCVLLRRLLWSSIKMHGYARAYHSRDPRKQSTVQRNIHSWHLPKHHTNNELYFAAIDEPWPCGAWRKSHQGSRPYHLLSKPGVVRLRQCYKHSSVTGLSTTQLVLFCGVSIYQRPADSAGQQS